MAGRDGTMHSEQAVGGNRCSLLPTSCTTDPPKRRRRSPWLMGRCWIRLSVPSGSASGPSATRGRKQQPWPFDASTIGSFPRIRFTLGRRAHIVRGRRFCLCRPSSRAKFWKGGPRPVEPIFAPLQSWTLPEFGNGNEAAGRQRRAPLICKPRRMLSNRRRSHCIEKWDHAPTLLAPGPEGPFRLGGPNLPSAVVPTTMSAARGPHRPEHVRRQKPE
jgi:hypothetical protein